MIDYSKDTGKSLKSAVNNPTADSFHGYDELKYLIWGAEGGLKEIMDMQ